MERATEIWKLSDDQRELVERFEAAYNSIDRFLRKHLRREQSVPFASLVAEYERTHKMAADSDYLWMAAELRNVLVHRKTKSFQPVAVPTMPVVETLERICRRLTDPPLVMPRFQRAVEVVTLEESLAKVLKRVAQRGYSQFPVYDAEQFRGLLTENGITRWLAHHVSRTMSLVELDEVPVRQVLPEEEKRQNCLFVSRSSAVDDVKVLFAEKELLEAALITQTGDRAEKLIGIVTRWDVLHND
jgi:predicted transcriptional regulator